jgi:hypothetical protein
MQHEWFPATVHQPQTCATFQVLRHFHLQSFQSKISTIHFYNALERETENVGLETPPVRSHNSMLIALLTDIISSPDTQHSFVWSANTATSRC